MVYLLTFLSKIIVDQKDNVLLLWVLLKFITHKVFFFFKVIRKFKQNLNYLTFILILKLKSYIWYFNFGKEWREKKVL